MKLLGCPLAVSPKLSSFSCRSPSWRFPTIPGPRHHSSAKPHHSHLGALCPLWSQVSSPPLPPVLPFLRMSPDSNSVEVPVLAGCLSLWRGGRDLLRGPCEAGVGMGLDISPFQVLDIFHHLSW